MAGSGHGPFARHRAYAQYPDRFLSGLFRTDRPPFERSGELLDAHREEPNEVPTALETTT